MPINPGMMSSQKNDWETPADLYNALDRLFSFDLDPCASHDNFKTPRYFTEEDDGLSQKWTGRVFMNPPYGRVIGDWIAKAYNSAKGGDAELVVCLIPSRTDTKYWHEYVMKADLIYFIKGRVHFSGLDPAPFPSAIVIYWSKANSILPLIDTWDLKEMNR